MGQAQQQRINLGHVAREWKSVFAPPVPYVPADAVTQSLVGRLPEIEAGEITSRQYSQGVEQHFVEGERLIEERVRMQRGRLEQAVWEQKRLHSGQLDRVAVQISLRMDQLAQQQYLQLFQIAQHQKSLLEQQACSLTMEYLHREMQGKMSRNQVESQDHLRRQLQLLDQEAFMKPLNAMLPYTPEGLVAARPEGLLAARGNIKTMGMYG